MDQIFRAGAGWAELAFPAEYFPSDNFSGVHDPMRCRALLLEEGEVRGGLVVLELPSVRPWERTDELRALAAELLGAPYENVWLVVTHDLAAPHVPQKDAAHQQLHMDVLRKAVTKAAGDAAASLREAVVRYGEGRSDVNANRDVESVDGWWVGIDGKGPSDKTLSLLRFDGADGRPIAVLYSYAIKSSVLEGADMSDGKRYASGDVTGRASTKAEEKLGCPVLFVMGAAGDQVPKRKANYLALDEQGHFRTVDLREEGYTALEELSDTLARDIAAAASAATPEGSPVLRFEKITLECAGKKPYPKTLPEPPVLQYTYEPSGTEKLDIWAVRVGEAVLLGVKPEITTPIFDVIKEQSPFPHTLMATLVNGGQGYIATDWDFPRFSYPGLHTPFQPGTDRQFSDSIQALLKRMR